MKFDCPLDIFAHYLKYPPAFTAWLKAQGYQGYIVDSRGKPETGHVITFAKYKAAQR